MIARAHCTELWAAAMGKGPQQEPRVWLVGRQRRELRRLVGRIHRAGH